MAAPLSVQPQPLNTLNSAASLLERLPAFIRRGEPGVSVGAGSIGREGSVLSLGPELDEVLPDGGLPRGAVVELSITGGSALGTSVALTACRVAQQEAGLHGGDVPWCAIVDPSGTLHGPGVARAGVRLDRLLVVRPPLSGTANARGALERTTIRLAESQAFAVLVVDLVGVPGAPFGVALGGFPRVIRKPSLAAEASGASVVLLTDSEARRPLPLPVALRIELQRTNAEKLSVRIGKDRRGRISGARSVVWGRSRALRPAPTAVQAVPELSRETG